VANFIRESLYSNPAILKRGLEAKTRTISPAWRVSVRVALLAVSIAALLSPGPASAQLLAAKDGPIVYGHHHLNVTSIDAHKKLWVDTLGGKSIKIGTSPNEVRGRSYRQSARWPAPVR
jgi:hypothetical protein